MQRTRGFTLVIRFLIASLFMHTLLTLSAESESSSMLPSVMGVYDRGEDFSLGSLQVAPIDTLYMSLAVWNLLDSLGADSVQREFPAYGPGDTLFVRPDGKQVRLPDLSRLYLIHFTDSIDFVTFQALYNGVSSTSSVYPSLVGTNELVPSDLSSTNQKYLFGRDSSDQAIDAVSAWDLTTGDSTQIVAIADNGIYTTHSDLAGRILGGFSYDIFSSWDATGDHGTGVASVLMASANNGGMVGMNHEAKLFFIRSTSSQGFASAAVHAQDSVGAEMLNYSVRIRRTGNACLNSEMDFSRCVRRTWLQGLTITASQGNSNIDTDTVFRLTSGFPGAVGVGGLGVDGLRFSTSNHGNGMKVLSPGQSVYNAFQANNYRSSNGTSLASPIAGGALSLIRSANPKLFAGEAEQLLYQTAIDDESAGIGYDKFTGWGTIDVGAAVARADSFPALFRTNTTVAVDIQIGPAATKYVFNCGFNSNLPTGSYANVKEYRCTGTVTFPFNHMPIAMVRTRSVDGWPLTTKTNDGFGWAADTIVQFPWAEIDAIDTATNTVTVSTGAYYISAGAGNPASAVGWWPCNNPPCMFLADIDLQVTIAGRSTPGDANCNTFVNLADVTYMTTHIFSNGPGFAILNDADANADCSFNIGDVTYMIAWIFSGGPGPLDSDCVPGSLKPTAGDGGFVVASDVAIDVGAKVNNKRMLKYNATRKVNALAIRLKALNGAKINVTKKCVKSNLYWSQDGADVIIGLIDPEGQDFFLPSDSDLVEISGAFEIVSVEATDIHANGITEYLRPGFTAGKFTADSDPTIGEFSLDGAFPNPFNPETQIAFSLPVTSNVKIEIYNILGQRVITLTDSRFESGSHTVSWNSQDESGSTVASGMYFARMSAGDFSASKKLVILK